MRPVGAGLCLSRMLKRKLLLGAEQWMAANADLVLTMDRWDYETAKKYRLGQKVVNVPGVGVDFSRFDRVSSDCRVRRWAVEVTHFFSTAFVNCWSVIKRMLPIICLLFSLLALLLSGANLSSVLL